MLKCADVGRILKSIKTPRGQSVFSTYTKQARLIILRALLVAWWPDKPLPKAFKLKQHETRFACVFSRLAYIGRIKDINLWVGGKNLGLSVPHGIRFGAFYWTTRWLVLISCHELAHKIQDLLYKRHPARTFKEFLEYEHEACALSYYIYKAYFNDLLTIGYNSFRCYESKSEKNWLRRYWYKI